MNLGNRLKLSGQALILAAVFLQLLALGWQNKENNSLDNYQARLWDAEHRRSLNERLIAKTQKVGLSKPLVQKREGLLDKEKAAREALIRSSQRSADERSKIRSLELLAAALFLIGSIVLLLGEFRLAQYPQRQRIDNP